MPRPGLPKPVGERPPKVPLPLSLFFFFFFFDSKPKKILIAKSKITESQEDECLDPDYPDPLRNVRRRSASRAELRHTGQRLSAFREARIQLVQNKWPQGTELR